ncbi:MAG TPA: acyltransferase [Ktedonobacterales bacterium]
MSENTQEQELAVKTASSSTGTLPALDGLRGLAIALVLWYHLMDPRVVLGSTAPLPLYGLLGSGFSGVFLFFVLSGFLLFLPYARALLSGQRWPSAREFYRRRALRILPAYYVSLAFVLLTQVALVTRLGSPTLVYLLALLLHDTRIEAFNLAVALNLPLWTLAVEWQFYLLLPWLALGLAKLAKGRTGTPQSRDTGDAGGTSGSSPLYHRHPCRFWVGLGLAGLVLLGLGIRALAALLHYGAGVADPMALPGLGGVLLRLAYGVKGKYLEVFALGMALCLFYVFGVEQGRLSAQLKQRLSRLACLGALIGLIGCVFWSAAAGRITPAGGEWIFPPGASWSVLGEWTLGLCFALLLMGVLLGGPMLNAIFSWAPLRFLGKISFSLYLWHVPLLALLPPMPSYPLLVLVSLAVVLPWSAASYYLIERPFLRWRRLPRAVNEQTLQASPER